MRSFVQSIGLLAVLGCQDQTASPTGGETRPIPPPAPNFSSAPIPVATLARITPIGYNNEVFPTPHTYWLTCDVDIILQGSRPCHRERQPIVAPGSGTVRALSTAADGYLTIEGPPGLRWTFGHITPAPGLTVGSQVQAGQMVATMFYDHGFDFGLTNYGVVHSYILPARYNEGYLYAQNPIAQFPDPLKTDLLTRVNSLSDPLGRVSFDITGTTSGGWFIAGSPKTNEPLQVGNEYMLLWLARYVERVETRIAAFGQLWPGMANRLLAVDAGAPAWEDITPATGSVALRLWNMGVNALPNTASPAGTFLVELTSPTTLRVEWFNTHGPVNAFTTAARMYER